jgi:hypothetical protein
MLLRTVGGGRLRGRVLQLPRQPSPFTVTVAARSLPPLPLAEVHPCERSRWQKWRPTSPLRVAAVCG